jgi:hypothetical protein
VRFLERESVSERASEEAKGKIASHHACAHSASSASLNTLSLI